MKKYICKSCGEYIESEEELFSHTRSVEENGYEVPVECGPLTEIIYRTDWKNDQTSDHQELPVSSGDGT